MQTAGIVIPVEHDLPDTDLRSLFERQKQLMVMIGMSTQPVDDIVTSLIFKDVLINMMEEVAETLGPITVNTKPWKLAKRDEVREHVKEELIDVFFFWLEALIVAGISPDEAVRRYEDKRQYNMNKRLADAMALADRQVAPASAQFPHILQELPAIIDRTAGGILATEQRRELWRVVASYNGDGNPIDKGNLQSLYAKVRAVLDQLTGSDHELLAKAIGISEGGHG